MLLKIRVSNFLSFEKLTEFSMIPSSRVSGLSGHIIKTTETPLLKYGVIYGANAAGKSNLVEIFKFIKRCVQFRVIVSCEEEFCKNSEANKNRESLFEIQFTLNGRYYAYGFTLLLNEQEVRKEWLYKLDKDAEIKKIFEWEKGKKPVIEQSLLNSDFNRFKTYLDDFDETANTLFLHVMNKDKRYDQGTKIYVFREVFSWITSKIVVVKPDTALKSFEYYDDQASISTINSLIKIFDTGITKVEMIEITLEELRKELAKPVFEHVLSNYRLIKEQGMAGIIAVSMRSNQTFIRITAVKGGEPKITTLSLKHGSAFYKFKYSEESDGTKRLFELLDMLLSASEDVIYVVDEMERSLHPKLTRKFLELFGQRHYNKCAQLVFTTHESTIMDLKLFRRDEIWFVERDNKNNSSVYSLEKFKERYDKQLSKAYLDGRYGAIPVFSSFNFDEGE